MILSYANIFTLVDFIPRVLSHAHRIKLLSMIHSSRPAYADCTGADTKAMNCTGLLGAKGGGELGIILIRPPLVIPEVEVSQERLRLPDLTWRRDWGSHIH